MSTFYPENDYRNYLKHYGVKGMRWRKRSNKGLPNRHRSDLLESQRNSHKLEDHEPASWHNNGKPEDPHRSNISNLEGHEPASWHNNGKPEDPHRSNISNAVREMGVTGAKRHAQADLRNHHGLASLKGRRLNKGQRANNIPGVDDKSIEAPIRQRENHSGRRQDLYKFGRKHRR